MILRARAVVTMDGTPIDDGAVALVGHEIRAVGRFADLEKSHPGPVINLGAQALLPGLINAHCHLDYTMMRSSIGPQKTFTAWIKRINALKRSLDSEDYLRAIAAGFVESKRSGVTTVLNIESFPELLWQMPPPPIRTWWFYELIDLRGRIATEELVTGALLFFQQRPEWLGGFGISPHAPYTASESLYRLANQCSRQFGMPLTTHVAESSEEHEMFRHARGPLHDFMSELGRDMSDCGERSSLARLQREGLVDENCLLVHLNELDDDEIASLENRSVVHCPRSHRYFSHSPFQFKKIRDAGANICVGTDSLASNDSLNFFEELRALKRAEPWLCADDLLKMATVNPARALRQENSLGRIRTNATADLIAVPFTGSMENVYDEILDNHARVEWIMINGKIA